MNNPTDTSAPQETDEVNSCPPWCSDHEESAHASKDRAAGPMLARLYAARGAQPTVDLVRDARRDDDDRPLSMAEAIQVGKMLFALAATASLGPQPTRKPDPWPSWFTVPCPSWCDYPDIHVEHDCYDDRIHTGASRSVVLTANDDGASNHTDPDTADMFIRQHYRETEPRIELGPGEAPVGLQFTADEAEEFAMKLLELAAIARTK